MFYLTYLRQELRRRLGRTLLTVLGLAVGIALVVAVTAMSRGLDKAQETVLGPLSGVATDLTVTKPVTTPEQPAQRGPGGPGGPGLAGGATELVNENAQLTTDLSKLGKPGTKFSRDFFVATQLTFSDADTASARKIDDVRSVSSALTLQATHQEGTVPQIVSEIQTGGETITQTETPAPMTEAERAAFEKCVESRGGFQRGEGPAQPGATPGPPPQERGPGTGRFDECLPARFRQFTARITTPLRTLRQVLDPPQTDITSTSYTITGINPANTDVALISPAQVTTGRFLRTDGEALMSQTYADKVKLGVGKTLTINGTKFTVVGLVKPPLGGQQSDVYTTLAALQKLSGRAGRVNVVLVRAASAGDVARVSKAIESELDGAQVADAKDLADKVSGSLVDAARLARGLGAALAAVALLAAFLIASLVTLSSVSKRVRELGTLKAIGWRQATVVRQVVAESFAQGLLGGVLGVALGVAAAAALGAFAPELRAEAVAATAQPGLFGLGAAQPSGSTAIRLQTSVSLSIGLIAVGLAVAGGLIAGGAGALRAARLRPADAMRDVG